MAGHGGGAWKVAYADFVTAMMAFFMVMWITAQSKQVKVAVAHYFNEPTAGQKVDAKTTGFPDPDKNGKPSLDLPDPSQRMSLDPFSRRDKGAVKGGKPAKAEKPDRPNLAVLHDGDQKIDGAVVPFEEGTADLNDQGKEQLRRLVPLLQGKRFKIEIRGHATRRPLPPDSPYRDAWQLSYARCVATMTYMEAAGIEPDRLRLSQAGPFEPSTLSVELAKQGHNSRVEVYALNEVVDDFVATREEREERLKDPSLTLPDAGKRKLSDSGKKDAAEGEKEEK